MKYFKKYSISLLLSFGSQVVVAQEKIETDRPDQTESAYLTPKKYFQFEFGVNMEKEKSNGIKNTTYVLPTGLLKYGISDNVELRVEFQSTTTESLYNNIEESNTSFQPLEVGLKTKLWEEKGCIPKTSLILHTSIPAIASHEFRKLKPAANFRFTCQNSLSDNWGLGYNAGMDWDGESTTPTYTYTLSPGFTINEKWAGYVEIYGYIKEQETPEHAVDGGIYFFPKKDIKLDFSTGFGLTKPATDFFVALGISFRWKG
jgi:hypothetical protein